MNEDVLAISLEPFSIFSKWLAEATDAEPSDPNAAGLATCGLDGQPTLRMVLVKHVDEIGFRFFTNVESKKGVQIGENPRAALCFHWKSLKRQVRVEGTVLDLDSSTTDAYFQSRSRLSQIGAVLSRQSSKLSDRSELEKSVEAFAASQDGPIIRPARWRGFCIHPQRIEFWREGPNRLHQRTLYTKNETGWSSIELYP